MRKFKYTSVVVTPDGRVSRSDAARFLGFSRKTLAEWARVGKGPRGRRVGGRVFYHIDDLGAFAAGGDHVNRGDAA